jgi:hypothetical protein
MKRTLSGGRFSFLMGFGFVLTTISVAMMVYFEKDLIDVEKRRGKLRHRES